MIYKSRTIEIKLFYTCFWWITWKKGPSFV